jgi:hypothetical protein
MIPLILTGLAILFTLGHLLLRKQAAGSWITVLLSYLIFFNIGIMGLMAFIAHTFRAEETAALIGWPAGSPFQTEIAVANLAFGILGLMSLRFRGLFWLATVIGYSLFLLGAFIVHWLEFLKGNAAPYNSGIFVWFGDLALPSLLMFLLWAYLRNEKKR